MAEARDAFERIMGLGEEEMAAIGERDTDRIGRLVREREDSISAFMASDEARQDQAFLEKLLSIQAMNTRLGHEARVLHQSLKEELLKLRSENRRLGGYRNGALVTPLNRHVLSRKG